MRSLKMRAVLLALDLGYNTLLTDSDVVWLRDARPIMREAVMPNKDMSFQCDSPWTHQYCTICAGFFYSRPTDPARKSLNYLVEQLLEVSS